MPTPLEVISPITIDNFGRAAVEAAKEHNPTLGILEQKGNIVAKNGGENVYWPVEAGEYAASTVGDYDDISAQYVPKTLHAGATLPWGEMVVADALSKGQMRRNRGEEALVDFKTRRTPKMFRSMLTEGSGSLGYRFLRDDGTSGAQPFYGLGAIHKYDAALVTDREASITAGSTYAGLSLVSGGLSTVDNADPYAWTPRGINTNFDWDGNGASDLTKSNFNDIFSYAQSRVTFGSDASMKPDCVIMDRTYFDIGRSFIGDKQQIHIAKPDAGDNKWGLGNSVEMFYHNGLAFYWDAHQASGVADILNFDQIELCRLNPVGPISGDNYPGSKGGDKKMDEDNRWFELEFSYNDTRRGINVSATFPGQFKFKSPRYQCRVKDFV